MSRKSPSLDLGTVAALVVDHLRTLGLDASARRAEIRVAPGLRLRLWSDTDPADEAAASMFWIDVDGLRLEPPMRLDVSGRGWSPQDRAIDAAHGILEAVLPPLRWLAAEPWTMPDADDGRVLRLTDDGPQSGWTMVTGSPWVVVGSDTTDPDAAAASLRSDLASVPWPSLDPLDDLLARLTQVPRGHWIKVFAGRYEDDFFVGRIDVDNEASFDGKSLAAALPWQELEGTQIVRQLIVLRPDGETPRHARARFGLRVPRL